MLARGEAGGEYGERLRQMISDHRSLRLHVLDDKHWPNGLTRDDLDRLVGEGVKRFGWRLVVVDYLGLLLAPDSDQGTYDTDLRNSSALRKLARRHDVALLVVAALRKTQGTKFKKPQDVQLDDLAGAGRLAYDAQTVLLVWREHGDDDTGLIHVRPLKMRFAPLQDDLDIQLRWHPRTGAIKDLVETDELPG